MKKPTLDASKFEHEERELDLKSDNIKECDSCAGTGVTRLPLDYPCFETERYCQECETGQLLAAQVAEIVALTLRRGRMRAA